MDTSPGTFGEFLQNALDREIAEEEEAYDRRGYWDRSWGRISDYRDARVRTIRRLQAAKQILKTLEEHELEFEIELSLEQTFQKKLGRSGSLLRKIEQAKMCVLRTSNFKIEVTVLVGEVKLELPEKYWGLAATKAPR